ncbi:hypothetical protein [Kocuria sp. SM24M-10]|uniref:hypothetical protein n=1 Tax=Kocuria sp. SM24M-10 TaxID=1660349 RepID=UPI000B0EEBDC|nr:hypothetical protein [Kocuria sp. SM24M-10]
MSAPDPRALRPVTITQPGEVLLDLDGVPTAVGPSHSVSGLLYGWPEPTTDNEEN